MSVGIAIGILYQAKIDELLPDKINIDEIIEGGKNMRLSASRLLSEVMENFGADYGIIQDYIFSHQEVGAWTSTAKAVKYFLYLQIREDCRYLFNSGSGSERPRFFFKGLNVESFLNDYLRKVDCSGRNESMYIKSIVFYKAFTVIGLNNLKQEEQDNLITTGDDGRRCIKVTRSVNSKTIPEEYRRDGKFPNGIPNGIADAVSFGMPPQAWMDKFGHETHSMKIPISNFLVAYYLSPELCRDGDFGKNFAMPDTNLRPGDLRDSKAVVLKMTNTMNALRSQRESICDMSTCQIEVIPK